MTKSSFSGDILVGDAAVDDHGVDLIVHELVDEIGHELEGDKVRAGHIIGDDVGLGRAGLGADGLAVKVGEGLVLVRVLLLDEDHRRIVGVVGVGEIGGFLALVGRFHRGNDDVEIALLEGGQQVVKGHVLGLEGLAGVVGDVLRDGRRRCRRRPCRRCRPDT